ncbi:MAG TPA: hypothetical protein VL172_04155 [Kofleriaceae bacterium]|jgi:hypothetical protein|nr:hypothetical protein [Kofleriaceae bacterium]
MHRLAFACLALTCASACVDDLDGRSAGDPLSSAEGVQFTIEWDGYVYVPRGADDGTVKWHMQRQIKSALGALREAGIGIADRDAQRFLGANPVARTPLTVVDGGATVAEIDRVTYHYRDTALVDKDLIPTGPFDLTLLFGDYPARRGELVPACSDDPAAEADSLWYHFSPRRWDCRSKITAENAAIGAATSALASTATQIARADYERRFLPSRAVLTPVTGAPELYPEYDKLWGFAGDPARTMVVVYSFFGVDSDESNAQDSGLREYLRFERTLRARFPGLHVTYTAPQAMLLDFWIDGQKLPGITFDMVERWILDRTGWPAAVGSDAGKRAELERQVIDRFSERWIYWQLPVQVTDGSTARRMTIELRTFHGLEDGSSDIRLHARWRYLEAFWHGDVFTYTGHSHFGHGPLEPWDYSGSNFPDRYQVLLFNSCLSFNYYDQDFLDMHPGGSQQLDVVVNGLAAYWEGMGQATANLVLSLIDGEDKTWRQVLRAMRVDLPWQAGYDPMRAVNGELDNQWTASRPLTVTPQ